MKDKVVVVTGGASGIGAAICEEFAALGAKVAIIDVKDNSYFVGDVGVKADLDAFGAKVLADFGKVDLLVNNALPIMKGISECSYEDFAYAQAVGVVAPFYLSKLFANSFGVGGSILNISSSRDRMSQAQTESYTAAKGGISALTHAMAVSFGGRVRVNSISPGWIDTTDSDFAGSDCSQHPAGRVGVASDIANLAVFLASDKAGFITGENICVDGGMTKLMVYHGDNGWCLDK